MFSMYIKPFGGCNLVRRLSSQCATVVERPLLKLYMSLNHSLPFIVSSFTSMFPLVVRQRLVSSVRRALSTVISESKPVLYQYAICPFCHRVKAYLDFLKIDYKAVEVNPLTKKEIKFSEYKKVPLAVIEGQTIKESGDIIDHISKTLCKKESLPDGFFSEDTQIWNDWSEKKLAVMLYPNITRSFGESWECFSYSNDVKTWSAMERLSVRVLGSVAMSFVNGKIKKKYGIVREREELYSLLEEWTTAVGGKAFLHGESPSMPDVLVYGVISAVEGTQTHTDIMTQNKQLKVWYGEMKKRVTDS